MKPPESHVEGILTSFITARMQSIGILIPQGYESVVSISSGMGATKFKIWVLRLYTLIAVYSIVLHKEIRYFTKSDNAFQ